MAGEENNQRDTDHGSAGNRGAGEQQLNVVAYAHCAAYSCVVTGICVPVLVGSIFARDGQRPGTRWWRDRPDRAPIWGFVFLGRCVGANEQGAGRLPARGDASAAGVAGGVSAGGDGVGVLGRRRRPCCDGGGVDGGVVAWRARGKGFVCIRLPSRAMYRSLARWFFACAASFRERSRCECR